MHSGGQQRLLSQIKQGLVLLQTTKISCNELKRTRLQYAFNGFSVSTYYTVPVWKGWNSFEDFSNRPQEGRR